jgi:serine/threonine protein kinase
VGTRCYQAPEVLEKKGYRGDKVDIFSMGVILFTMVTGVMPYFEARIDDPLYSLILARNSEAYWEKWN